MDIAALVETKKNPKIPDIAPGDTVKVSARIVEAGKERIQIFQGVVIKIKRGGNGASFTVRHVAYGIGVERTFPYNSPLVEKVEIVRQGKVRRSRLYYLRSLSSKEARRKIKRVERKSKQVGEELLAESPEEVQEPEEILEEGPEAVTEEEVVAAVPDESEVDTQAEAVVEEAKAVETSAEADVVEALEPEVTVAEAPEPQPEIEAGGSETGEEKEST